MTRYILAAATHEEVGGSLLSSASKQVFRERITPLVTDQSLILLEGDFIKGAIDKEHPLYAECSVDIAEVIGDARPTIMAADPRFEVHANAGRAIAMNKAWINQAITTTVEEGWALPAKTQEELIAYLKTSPVHPELDMEVTGALRVIAQWVNTMTRTFDRRYIDLMRRKGPRHDVCVLIAGAGHCMSIASKTDYEYIRLAPPGNEEALLFDYLAYLANCVWAGAALQKRATG